MPKYFAYCGYDITFRLSARLQTVEENGSLERWDAKNPESHSEGWRYAHSEYLVGEAEEQSRKVVEQAVVMVGKNPLGIEICEEGLVHHDSFVGEYDWKEMFKASRPNELNLSHKIEMTVDAGSSLHFRLRKTSDPKLLYDQADPIAIEMTSILAKMIKPTGKIPAGWRILGGIDIELTDVSVWKEKTFWEKSANPRLNRSESIPRPRKHKTFRVEK